MTKEQGETIEILKQDLELAKKEDVIDIDVLTGYLEIALNLIQEQQEENKKKDNAVRKIISRLDNDYKRITETLQDGKHCDDYNRNRLKAYRTKTREIKEYIEEQYFEDKVNSSEQN